VHHPVEKSPEQDVSEEPADQAAGEQQAAGLEALVPAPARLQDEQQGEQEGGQEVEDEAVEAREAQDAGRGAGQRRHRRPAVVQHRRVAAHRQLTDELRPFALCHNGRHRRSPRALSRSLPESLRTAVKQANQQDAIRELEANRGT